ncbi:ATP-dependent RNA helicase DbpA [Gilvimarinus xylanilyticus]|uniref:ATP-dependent RNA helicase DbpA n=1 Tax=Gilvimarinus xylanilyticus TaxID=2944139 RepID=A0A9X2I1E7_9GAMM|nr:ATP-dependent RNA helicase DbpA [Gilvimarinus xylanilyticus]
MPDTQTAFSFLGLQLELQQNLKSLGYTEMTPIQAESLPAIIAGRDVIGQGKTGSGKTAAFGLGVLNALEVKRFCVQALVLCPTRELADQVAKEIRRLARAIHNIKVLTVCGGMPFGPQINSLEHGAHIVVGTPGRVEEHIRKNNLDLSQLSMLVLDEADRMLEMGFAEALDAVIDAAPLKRQTLLFSATYPAKIEQIAKRVMQEPVLVKVESSHDTSSIQQSFYAVTDEPSRVRAVQLLLLQHQPESAVVFCNTKRETQQLANALAAQGFSALALHGDLEQRDRDITLVRFANKSATVLVATDVAARGLDIENLDMVINYQLARDSEVHVHRVGRTGRAGAKGIACNLHSDKEHYKLLLLEEEQGLDVSNTPLPKIDTANAQAPQPAMVTLQIDGGKKQKVRPGDILGCLTGDKGIDGKAVGKINIADNSSFVAVKRTQMKKALDKIRHGKLKGRQFRVRVISA